MEKAFIINIIRYAFWSNFATLTDFEVINSFSKTKFVPKNPKLLRIWELLIFRAHSTANLQQFSDNKFQFRNDLTFGQFQLATECDKKRTRLVDDFTLPYFKYGRKLIRNN